MPAENLRQLSEDDITNSHQTNKRISRQRFVDCALNVAPLHSRPNGNAEATKGRQSPLDAPLNRNPHLTIQLTFISFLIFFQINRLRKALSHKDKNNPLIELTSNQMLFQFINYSIS